MNLSGKAKHDTCTHRQRRLGTQKFLLDWGAKLMAVEPTNWRMTAEKAACWDIGRSPGEPRSLESSWDKGFKTRVQTCSSWRYDFGKVFQPHPSPPQASVLCSRSPLNLFHTDVTGRTSAVG